MSFERRISSLPLYTKNLHIFPTSGHLFASGRNIVRVKGQVGYDSKARERRCSGCTENMRLGLPAIKSLQLVGHGVRHLILKIA